jgi:hypothetical protein
MKHPVYETPCISNALYMKPAGLLLCLQQPAIGAMQHSQYFNPLGQISIFFSHLQKYLRSFLLRINFRSQSPNSSSFICHCLEISEEHKISSY